VVVIRLSGVTIDVSKMHASFSVHEKILSTVVVDAARVDSATQPRRVTATMTAGLAGMNLVQTVTGARAWMKSITADTTIWRTVGSNMMIITMFQLPMQESLTTNNGVTRSSMRMILI
jgi:hypothetical protein